MLKHIKFLIFFYFLFPFFIYSSLSIDDFEKNSVLYNAVFVPTGSYVDKNIDMVVSGPDDIIISRYYHSSDKEKWRYFPYCYLLIGKEKNKSKTVSYVGEHRGSILKYFSLKSDCLQLSVDLKAHDGMTNNFSEIGGKTNYKNNNLEYIAEQDVFKLIAGDGSQRYYKKSGIQEKHEDQQCIDLFDMKIYREYEKGLDDIKYYILDFEILPSGNKIIYDYDNFNRVIKITSLSAAENNIFGWVSIDYEKLSTKNKIVLSSSEKQQIEYVYSFDVNVVERNLLLESVVNSQSPEIKYSYSDENSCIIKKETFDKQLVIEYFQDGKVENINNQYTLNGNDLYAFNYEIKKNRRGDFQSGSVDVTTYRNAKYKYLFNKNYQIERIEKYLDSGKLYSVEERKWGKRSFSSFIQSESFKDSEENILLYNAYTYDSFGNIIEKQSWGNFTGKSNSYLQVDSKGNPLSTQECICVKKIYSKDGLNLLLEEGDKASTKVKYSYIKGTNLLSQKTISNKYQVLKRFFFEYNDDKVLIKTFIDDGIDEYWEEDPSWSGVHYQFISQIVPNRQLPGVGKALIHSEKYWDLDECREKLLSKMINTFDDQGLLINQDFYDSNEVFLYSLQKGYDQKNNLSFSNSPKNGLNEYRYNNNELIFFQDEFNKIEYKHDYKNNEQEEISYYSDFGKLIKKQIFDPLDNLVKSIDIFGNQTVYEYDCFGRLIKIIYPPILTENGRAERAEEIFEYDIFNNLITSVDANGYATKTIYNVRGQPTIVHYPDGTFEKYAYDVEGPVHRKQNRDGTLLIYEYDDFGRIVLKEHFTSTEKGPGLWLENKIYEYDSFNLLSVSDDNSNEINYSYDFAGRLIKKCDSANIQTIYGYDTQSRIISEKVSYKNNNNNNNFIVKLKKYDHNDHVIEEKIQDSSKNTNIVKSFKYDARGNIIEKYLNDTLIEKKNYNSLGLVQEIIDAQNNTTKISYDYHFLNEIGQNVLRITKIAPNGNIITTVFDYKDNIQKEETLHFFSKECISHSFYYDHLNNLTMKSETVFNNGSKIPMSSTKYLYGPMGRLEELRENYLLPNEKNTKIEYDNLGRICKKFQPGLIRPIIFEYDYKDISFGKNYYNACKITKILFPELKYTDNEYVERDNYLYHKIYQDMQGNILRAKSPNGVLIDRIYDFNNRLLHERVKDGNRSDYIVKYKNDYLGRVERLILPDNSEISYNYDGLFPKSVVRSNNQKKEIYKHHYEKYDLYGNLVKESLIGNAGYRESFFNNCNRKIGISHEYFDVYIPEESHDSSENIVKVICDNEPIEFSYDEKSRISQEKGFFVHSYKYDDKNNISSIDENLCELNEINQLLSCNRMKCSYDKRGFIKHKKTENNNLYFKHDSFGHLIEIEVPSENRIKYSYDFFGRRLSKTIVDSASKIKKIESYLYFGDLESGIIDKNSKIVQLKVPGAWYNYDTGRAIAFELEEEYFAPLYDFQGNVVTLIDSYYGEVAESYRYSAFGSEIIFDDEGDEIDESILENFWRYQGKRKDEITGLINFGLREYDPEMKRWIDPDPLGDIDGNNRYIFSKNNPISFIDLKGTSSHHYYVEHENFDEYFYYGRRNPSRKRGGHVLNDLFNIACSNFFDFIHNLNLSVIESLPFVNFDAYFPETEAGAFGRKAGSIAVNAFSLSQIVTGLIELGSGFIGFSGSAALELSSFGMATPIAIPAAAGSIALIASGATKIGIGVALFKNTKKNNCELYRVTQKSTNQIIHQLKESGLKIKGQSPDGKFIEFVDNNNRIRAKIHPPDRITKYKHLHLYDKFGNSLNSNYQIVPKNSIEAHIKIGE